MFPERKIKLVIAYDGTEYHGWQIPPGRRTDVDMQQGCAV